MDCEFISSQTTKQSGVDPLSLDSGNSCRSLSSLGKKKPDTDSWSVPGRYEAATGVTALQLHVETLRVCFPAFSGGRVMVKRVRVVLCWLRDTLVSIRIKALRIHLFNCKIIVIHQTVE